MSRGAAGAEGMAFVKGHGTGNDFLLLPDWPDPGPTPDQVRALCDRRTGLGADGVLRLAHDEAGRWFMDHRNADGSTAEMCGNGLRLFARYLGDTGRAGPGEQTIATRAGTRRCTVLADGAVRVEMGPATVGGAVEARVGGRVFTGVSVSMGNPHLVCLTGEPVAGLDLTAPPEVSASAFPDGVNVEFGNPSDGAVRMRVHERGVGETAACGTGACAVAAVHLGGPGVVAIDQPGGRVQVELDADGCWLTGPTTVVAAGVLDQEWLRAESAGL